MKTQIILAHPQSGSFNHAVADLTRKTLTDLGHSVFFHDLYQERFDPILTAQEIKASEKDLPQNIKDYLAELRDIDALIFVHPNWWGGPPAILRGWIDRVFRQDSVYNFTADGAVCHIGQKIVQVFTTSNTPRDIELNVYGDPLEVFWKTVIFGLLGSKSFERRNFESVVMSTADDRCRWLTEVEATLRRRFGR